MSRARACLCASASFAPRSSKSPPAVRRDQFLASLDQRGQRGLGIRANIQIHFRIMPELLNVALVRKVQRRSRDTNTYRLKNTMANDTVIGVKVIFEIGF